MTKWIETRIRELFNDKENDVQWTDIERDLNERYGTRKELIDKYEVNPYVVMIDMMVDKANHKLTDRSRLYLRSGKFLYGIGFVMVIILFAEYQYSLFGRIFGHHEEHVIFPNNPYLDFVLILIRKIVSGGAILGMVYILFATANSCFREATILLHRRHAMRYVRLLSYSTDGKIKSKDLRSIFGVDDVTNTGFNKIKTESIRDNLIGKLIEAVGGIYKRSGSKKEKLATESSSQRTEVSGASGATRQKEGN